MNCIKKYGYLIFAGICLGILFMYMPDKQEPVAGYDNPEGYYDYYRQITVPMGKKLSGYVSNYSFFEYRKAVKNETDRLKSASDYNWVQRGPANVGGRTRTIIIDPDDPTGNTWIVGSASGGIWITTDSGNSWKNLTPDLPNLSTASLAMARSNTQVIYAGTGEGYGGEGMVGGNGIYKSVDKGNSWFPIESIQDDEHFRFVNKIWVSPTSDSTLIAATNRGVFKSSDGGGTWDSVYVKGYAVQDIVQNPLNENVLYAGVNSLGVIKSNDKGDTWVGCYNGMTEVKRVSVSVSNVDTSYLYAGVEAPGAQTHIYQSRDAGESWQINYNVDGLFINFHQSQGWFNNAIAAHPFDRNKVYVGGVYLGMLEFGPERHISSRGVVRADTSGISKYMTFVRFGGNHFNGALSTGIEEGADVEERDYISVEIRFDTNLKQLAHRFTVPDGEGAGVPPEMYSYQDYVEVPFQAWDVENNRQLMISFRDQDKNGRFNLVKREWDDEIGGREYIFVHSVEYDPINPSADIAKDGGYEYKYLYFLWPALPGDTPWSEDSISKGNVLITYGSVELRGAYTTVLADDRLNKDLHVDHHDIKFFIPDTEVDSFIIIEANDGGLGVSTDFGSTWKQIKEDYLTTQFYGVAKRPGKHEYIGGMQDNGTWQSELNETANQNTNYELQIEGDGFEALWHPLYPQRILGSSYYNLIKVSNDFGQNWKWIEDKVLGDGPFITKLSHSRDNPDLVFAVGSRGVYRHTNFGLGTASWQYINLGDNWAINNTVLSSHHVKVSLAKPSVVWAGGGMYSDPDLNIFLSKDYGITFDTVTNYIEEEPGYISGMATHPETASEAFVLFSYKGKPKVLRTTNYGASWEDISGFAGHDGDSSINGFPDVVVNDLLVMPNDTNNIWVATEIGLFESTDNGNTWNYSNSGLPAVSVWRLDIADGHVIAATHGRGIWTADLGLTSFSKRDKEQGIEFEMYPNPAVAQLKVRTNSTTSGPVYLSVYDMSGKRYFNREFTLYELREGTEIDVTGFPKGNYIVILKTDKIQHSKKLIVR